MKTAKEISEHFLIVSSFGQIVIAAVVFNQVVHSYKI